MRRDDPDQAQPAPAQAHEFPAQARPDGHLGWIAPDRRADLAAVGEVELGHELVARLRSGGSLGGSDTSTWIGSVLYHELGRDLDVHANRFSRRRHSDLFGMFHLQARPLDPPVADATYVDLGCGSLNPFGMLFVFQMLGAQRGIAVDLDAIEDMPRACSALAELAALALIDPGSLLGDCAITREEILRNLEGYDLALLARGDPAGLCAERMEFRRDSVLQLSLQDACADVVLSNAFLEHVPHVEGGIAELARITRPGGMHVHNIDLSDHRRYDMARYELDFLREESDRPIVHYSNRLRMHEFEQLFAANGLRTLDRDIRSRAQVDEPTRASFAPRFRAMSREQLEPTRVVLFLRKQAG